MVNQALMESSATRGPMELQGQKVLQYTLDIRDTFIRDSRL